jgi:hypothetical protein
MDLIHLFAAIERFLKERLAQKFTGQIVITVNCNNGGIGNAQITSTFNIERPKSKLNRNEMKMKSKNNCL